MRDVFELADGKEMEKGFILYKCIANGILILKKNKLDILDN